MQHEYYFAMIKVMKLSNFYENVGSIQSSTTVSIGQPSGAKCIDYSAGQTESTDSFSSDSETSEYFLGVGDTGDLLSQEDDHYGYYGK